MKKVIVLLIVALFVFLFTPQSVKMFQKFISSHKNSSWAPGAQYQLGNFCFWTLRYSQAIECYQKFLNNYQGDPRKSAISMFRAAICYDRVRNYSAAIEAYDRFVQTYPSHKDADHAKAQLSKLREMYK